MAKLHEINTSLGALEAQLEELLRLKSLIERLEESTNGAENVVLAAEQTVRASKELMVSVQRLNDELDALDLDGLGDRIRVVTEETVHGLRALDDKAEELLNRAVQIDRSIDHIGHKIESTGESLTELGRRIENFSSSISAEFRQFNQRLDRVESLLSGLHQAIQNIFPRLESIERGQKENVERLRESLTAHNDHTSKVLINNFDARSNELRDRLEDIRKQLANTRLMQIVTLVILLGTLIAVLTVP